MTKVNDSFIPRHIGPSQKDITKMLDFISSGSIQALVNETIPKSILSKKPLAIGNVVSEYDLAQLSKKIAAKNKVFRTFIGQGYYGTKVPAVIQRNILENPGWYTQYIPYQAEISQGRLEALLVFQTMISDLTGLPLANASLLDEATAAAEAMAMFFREAKDVKRNVFFVSELCHPQTIDVLKTRSAPFGIELVIGNHQSFKFNDNVFLFGDAPQDMQAGKGAGTRTIGVTTGIYSKKQLEDAGADFVVVNLKDKNGILKIIILK